MQDTTLKLLRTFPKDRREPAQIIEQMQDQARENLKLWTDVGYELAGCWLAQDLLQRTKGDVEQAAALLQANPPTEVLARNAALDVLFPFADAPDPPANA